MTKRSAVVGVGAEIGLGAALCRSFASEGLHVLIAGRTPSRIKQVATSILAAGGSAEALPMDVTNEVDVVKLFDRAMAPAKGNEAAELIVYNSGGNQKTDFRELSADRFERFWRVGCFGGFLVGREAARRLVPLGRGTMIFTGASASLRASLVTRSSQQRKPVCAWSPRAWRANTVRRGSIWRTL